MDDNDWAKPPGNSSSSPFFVDFRLNWKQLADIDTQKSTADVKIGVLMHWTDDRLMGWPSDRLLPPTLWGPYLYIDNESQGMDVVETEFMLIDSSTGRLKRAFIFTGKVNLRMDLHDFPFDVQIVRVKFWTLSCWRLLDGSRSGQAPHGAIYRLSPVRGNNNEGQWINLTWDGSVPEFQLHGVSTRVSPHTMTTGGQELSAFSMGCHISRKSSFYVTKVLVPLYLLVILSFTCFVFSTDDLPSRDASISTYFLSAFAMLYVVDQFLPKADFLTKIDQLILASTCSLAANGVLSWFLSLAHEWYGPEVARYINRRVAATIGAIYFVVNLLLFLPPYLRLRHLHGQFAAVPLPRAITGAQSDNNGGDAVPLAEEGSVYYPLKSFQGVIPRQAKRDGTAAGSNQERLRPHPIATRRPRASPSRSTRRRADHHD
jgi:hypothetical protein